MTHELEDKVPSTFAAAVDNGPKVAATNSPGNACVKRDNAAADLQHTAHRSHTDEVDGQRRPKQTSAPGMQIPIVIVSSGPRTVRR